tara:strand:+ start:694 stop:1062 length:369 start_codon:yes stop_codon:yes gene_type:complete
MKYVLLFFLFLAISYYIFIQRKKIMEGHETRNTKSAARSSEIKELDKEIKEKEKNVKKLFKEVDELIKEEKQLSKSIKKLEESKDSKGKSGDSKICDVSECKSKKVNRKCNEFKKAAGVKCV